MNQLLQDAFNRAAALPPEAQDRFARFLLAEREVAMRELIGGMDPVMRAVSSVPGAGVVTAASYGYIRRVPGADVALGVMAYELASSTQAAVASAGRGRRLAADAESMVGNALSSVIGRIQGAGEHGVELARHATRGALHVGDELVEQLEGIVQSSMAGSLRALDRVAVDPLQSLYGAGYGVLQGALESGRDPVRAARAAIAAARGMASELGVTEDEAAQAVADGILTAASDTDAETLDSLREALPDELENSDDERS